MGTKKVIAVSCMTVKEFANFLLSLDEELQERPITYSGYNEFYLHDRAEEGVLTMDEMKDID